MSDHDLILLATKHGSWFGNTLEIRKENLIEAARELQHVAYHKGYDEGFRDAMREQVNYQSEKS